MLLIYKTINICINNNRKELETFKCLRYKIPFEYQLSNEDVINRGVVEKISTYLVDEVIKNYKSFKEKSDKLTKVKYESAIIHMRAGKSNGQKYTKRFRRKGTVMVSIVVTFLLILQISVQYQQIKEREYIRYLIMSAIILTIIIISLGAKTNVWSIFVVNKGFWIFSYENPKDEKIAAFGFCREYDKRYEFIGAVEDLISFYKILLYDKTGKKERDILIEKVKTKIKEDDDKKIRNSILLLLYYFDYEKCYLECEQKLRGKISGRGKEEKIKEKTLKRIKRKHIYDYEEMKIWMESIEKETAEYQLADSILKHIYKECEIEDGMINPEKLRNYKFEYYFDFMRSKVLSA